MITLQANLEIARRAMQAHQLAMSVIGTNIANVNTPGYSRRRAVVGATTEVDTGSGMVGGGADVRDIRRVRDLVLDGLYRKHLSSGGKWAALENYLAKVETVFNEPGTGGLGECMNAFWSAWQDLANEPDSRAIRSAVQHRGQELCNTFHRLAANLQQLQQSLSEEIKSQIHHINESARRLAELNAMVVEGESAGHEASGLRDERDLLIDDLAEIANIQLKEAADGSVTVMLGSQVLVQGDTARQLEIEEDVGGRPYSSGIFWKNTDTELVLAGGLLRGYLTARDELIQGYVSDLDTLAANLVAEINAVHSGGYGLDGSTGTDFFDPERVTAADMWLDPEILDNSDLIAASAGGEVGDGQNALAIANLSSALTMSGDSATFSTFYNTLIGRIGLDSREAQSFLETEQVLALEIENQRLGISGVSLDEEMSYLLTYQHAYEAMVRVTATIDEMMGTLISSLGV